MPQHLKAALLVELLKRGIMTQALVFTRTKHRANRLAEHLVQQRHQRRAHSRQPLAGRSARRRSPASRAAAIRVLVATDIAARGIDVEALSHVVNFDVPAAPEDYIHRVGRTGRAELTGDAFTFVAPDEEADLRAIERAIDKTLPRVTLPDFDYKAPRPSSRSRSRSGSRRSAGARRRSASARRPTPRGAASGGRHRRPAASGGEAGGTDVRAIPATPAPAVVSADKRDKVGMPF